MLFKQSQRNNDLNFPRYCYSNAETTSLVIRYV